MGFKKPLNYSDICCQLTRSAAELNNPMNDGYIQWSIKKELYEIKWLVDSILENSGKYVGEDEFLKDHNEQVFWDKLKK